NDGTTFATAFSTTTGAGGTETIPLSGSARYVRMFGSTRCRPTAGYSLQEMQVFGTAGGGGGGGDTSPPSAPTGVHSTAVAQTSVTLGWTASTDNVGVTGYDVFKDGALATSVAGTSATISGLTAATAYSFTVTAKDAAGNVSAASTPVSVTTTGGSGTPVLLSQGKPCLASSEGGS